MYVTPTRRLSPIERFLIKTDTSGDCWIWTAGRRNEKGYGMFCTGGRTFLAHRWLYEQSVGPVPDGMELDHGCRNRACVRPSHLEPVTHQENLLRGETVNARHAAKTHCVNGHAFDEKNTHLTKEGHRVCRTCRRDREREAYRRRRAASQASDS